MIRILFIHGIFLSLQIEEEADSWQLKKSAVRQSKGLRTEDFWLIKKSLIKKSFYVRKNYLEVKYM
ncbi:MAG: hypothetical protein A2309_06695 [Bacteroidetes bacterium RIFOXYB2_FULL_35_7]|nr:MAG: hypothetical protein A2309_06695 [Bacteroidetes bacterium RIFOXYB2_FULL_35_7]